MFSDKKKKSVGGIPLNVLRIILSIIVSWLSGAWQIKEDRFKALVSVSIKDESLTKRASK